MRLRGPSALLVSLGLVLGSCSVLERGRQPWWAASREPTGLAPSPENTAEAVIQVYAARAVGVKGALAVHTWIAMKPTAAPAYTRYEVMGWGVDRGLPAVRVNRFGADNYWFGARPELLLDRRGTGVDRMIERVEAAIAAYPYPSTYRTWPGPNSNTFTAWIGRSVPELRLDLPATAIGKDFLPNGALAAVTPSGSGVQISVYGLAGVLAGWQEGVEINLLGLSFGVDVKHPALKLPAIGRLGVSVP